jgi:hypothetical protein
MNEVLDYIEVHLEEIKQFVEESADTADHLWGEGATETLQHILAKFGRL